VKKARKTQRRVLLRDLLDEIKALRKEMRDMREATENNTAATAHNAIWVAQAARGKDSAGNWR
jgi:hypothetical protein